MKRFEFNLAWALMKSRKGKWYPNANVMLSVLGITVGITFLVSTVCMYDGYIKKLETIIFSIFPHITLQADIVEPENEDMDDDFYESLMIDNDEEKQCDTICQSKGLLILNDKECETATSLMKGKAFDLKIFNQIEKRLDHIPDILKLSPVILEEGNFICKYSDNMKTTEKQLRLRVLGVEPDDANNFVPEINRSIENQNILNLLNNSEEPVAILSTELYQQFFGEIKSDSFPKQLTFKFQITRDKKQIQKTITLKVVDIFKLGIHQITQNLMITSLKTAQELFDTHQYASFLGINLAYPYLAKNIAKSVKDQLFDTDILTFNWLDVAADMFNNLNLYRNIIISILLMSVLITSFIIYNTLHIMIIERKRQIGTLMALGISKVSIFRIFVIISQFEAIIGFIIGSSIGIFSGFYFGNYLNQQLHDYLPIQNAGIAIHGWSMLIFFLFVSSICLITALLSAGKAASLDPVQCLQSE
ncbi:membrane protein containing DUF214, permase predicted [Candidatus Magnetomorum sp. HK-1]|nr:membrane protein containing DUF214, permase predicted [Candidatus Magnetomorum sp. HK-1]